MFIHPLVLAGIIFFAIFTQSITGFGLGLISTALLSSLIDIGVVGPLVALVGITAEIAILLRYRRALNLRSVGRLSLASVIAIPIGALLLDLIDGHVILRLLGVLVVAYAAYGLLQLRLPTIAHPSWAYGFGFVSGILTGLYNVGGPPLVIYGTCRCWTPAEFRSNLQGLFALNSVVLIVTHVLYQHYTPIVWEYYLAALPAIAAALVVGFLLDRYVNAMLFRRLVLVVLAVIGARLILG
jgi:uncharacterized protein